jgi:hypothetical protein
MKHNRICVNATYKVLIAVTDFLIVLTALMFYRSVCGLKPNCLPESMMMIGA